MRRAKCELTRNGCGTGRTSDARGRTGSRNATEILVLVTLRDERRSERRLRLNRLTARRLAPSPAPTDWPRAKSRLFRQPLQAAKSVVAELPQSRDLAFFEQPAKCDAAHGLATSIWRQEGTHGTETKTKTTYS